MSLDNTQRPKKNALSSKWDIIFEKTPKEWIGFKPTLGHHAYVCYACCHTFSCLSSFQDHINRRVLVLKYKCCYCANQKFTFYNRCSFLLHTRAHYTLNQGKINLNDVELQTLPVSLAGFLPHPSIPLLYTTEEQQLPEHVYINTQFYTPNYVDRGASIITLKPNDILFGRADNSLALKQICANVPKCEFVTVEHQKLLKKQNVCVEHIYNINNITETTPNVLEIKQEPPDENEYTSNVTMPVISKVESLREKNFPLPTCLECNTIQKGTMTEHYLGVNRPCNVSLKCSICRFIASTQCSLKAHVRIHENIPPYVCPDCGKDFPTWPLLQKHMDDVCFHLAKHVRFRCPGKRCGKLFAITPTFSSHFQMHLKQFAMCSVCRAKIFNAEEVDRHKQSHKGLCLMWKSYECPLCPQINTLTEETYKEHANWHATDITKCMYVYMCKHCRSYFRSTATYATHLLKCSSKQTVQVKKYDIPRYVTRNCDKCTNKIIFNIQRPATLCNKCKQQGDNPKNVTGKKYFCILCNKQIQLHEKCYHMRYCKYAKPHVVITKLPVNDTENLSFTSSSSEFDSSSTPTRLRRRRSSDSYKTDDSIKKKRKRTHNTNVGKPKKTEADLTAEEPVQFDGTYRCKLCEYKNTDRGEFHEHIKEHRDISTAYQCMECAECFVVKPSLIKHLLHFHNIADYESYLKDNDCFDVDAVKELEDIMKLAPGESKEPVKENQCRVCRQQFSNALSLSKHFRIHGMAFLLKNTK